MDRDKIYNYMTELDKCFYNELDGLLDWQICWQLHNQIRLFIGQFIEDISNEQ
jgi:hypothetical protein